MSENTYSSASTYDAPTHPAKQQEHTNPLGPSVGVEDYAHYLTPAGRQSDRQAILQNILETIKSRHDSELETYLVNESDRQYT